MALQGHGKSRAKWGLGALGVRVLLFVLVADAAVVLLHLANDVSGADHDMLSLDSEHNLPTWVNSIQYFCVAAGAALAAVGRRSHSARAWLGLAAMFALFSLDESVMLHEKLVEALAGNGSDPVWYWPVVASPAFAVALFCLAVACADVRRELGSIALVVAGLACLGTALMLEGIGAELLDSRLYEVEVVLEESLELLGSALLLTVTLCMGPGRLGMAPDRAP